MIVTIFIPLYDGIIDNDIEPRVYEGRLSRQRVLEIGQELGDCYGKTAICGNNESGWYISYCNSDEDGNCPPPVQADPYNPAFGERYDETVPGCGSLSYDVYYSEVRRAL